MTIITVKTICCENGSPKRCPPSKTQESPAAPLPLRGNNAAGHIFAFSPIRKISCIVNIVSRLSH